MQISWVWAKQKRTCSLPTCETPIVQGEAIVVGIIRREVGYPNRFAWHRACYILQADTYLADHPFVHNSSNGKKATLGLTRDQQRLRHNVLVRSYTLARLKVQMIELGLPWRVQEIEEKQQKIRKELEVLGGVPTNWPK